MVGIANTKIGLDPNNSVIKSLWCTWGCQILNEADQQSILNFSTFLSRRFGHENIATAILPLALIQEEH